MADVRDVGRRWRTCGMWDGRDGSAGCEMAAVVGGALWDDGGGRAGWQTAAVVVRAARKRRS
ncbi:hypothetical protein GCM10009533_67300 [Saccharopolyspora spinosporotrichia]|uniref:Uncharacterized protein n=1 Tax=Saccharopolyspora erythraea TaxID=1836 RepID=A0ABN1E7K0_SACER